MKNFIYVAFAGLVIIFYLVCCSSKAIKINTNDEQSNKPLTSSSIAEIDTEESDGISSVQYQEEREQDDKRIPYLILTISPSVVAPTKPSTTDKTIIKTDDINVINVYGKDNVVTDTIYVNLYNNRAGFNSVDANIYFNDIYEIFSQISNTDGISASGMLAQAYTEGGAGKVGIYTKTNNCFGITAGTWKGYVYSRETGLCYQSQEVAKFYGASELYRVYTNISESVEDYVKLITTSSSYRQALYLDYESYLRHLLNNNYGESHMIYTWLSVINVYQLFKYDS